MNADILPFMLLALHGVVAALAIAISARSGCFTRRQVILQSLLATLVPLIGVVLVVANAKDAAAPPPKPDNSKFDRNYIGSGD